MSDRKQFMSELIASLCDELEAALALYGSLENERTRELVIRGRVPPARLLREIDDNCNHIQDLRSCIHLLKARSQ